MLIYCNDLSLQEKLFYDHIFAEFEVHPSHYGDSFRSRLHTHEDVTSIINFPEVTIMDHPMLSFNATEEAKRVLKVAEGTGQTRKSFHALMSGRGSGKTRTVCELRAELLHDHFNCLPIAITFNSNWTKFFFRKKFGDATEESTLIDLALEVVIRMASILYGVELIKLSRVLKSEVNIHQLKSFCSRGIITGFVEHAIGRVQMKGKKVDYFVLLIDESLRLARGIEGDGYEDIRGAFLDTKFGSKVHVGLVITSLAALPINKTISDREVHAIRKPSKLPIDETLVEWLRLEPTASSRLLLALLAPIPRAVQIFYNDILKKIYSNQPITTKNFSSLFQSLVEILPPAYNGAMFPSDNLLFKSLFNDQIIVTEEVEAMITHSVYTNVLDGADIGVSKIKPEPSVLIMYSSLLNVQCTEVASQFKKTIDRTLQQLTLVRKDNIGAVLEVLYLEYFCLRILSTNSVQTKVSLSELLGIKVTSMPGGRRRSMLESNLAVFEADHLMCTMKTTPPALSDTEAFSKFLSDLRANLSIGLWKSADGDPYDCLLMVRIDGYSKPFFFFLELKSPDVWPDDDDKYETTYQYRDQTQYIKSQAMIEMIIEKLPGDALFQADGYLYAYFVADDSVKSKVYHDSGRVVISGIEARNFLRCFRDFYRAIRALVNDPITKL